MRLFATFLGLLGQRSMATTNPMVTLARDPNPVDIFGMADRPAAFDAPVTSIDFYSHNPGNRELCD